MIFIGLAMGLVAGFYCGWVARETRELPSTDAVPGPADPERLALCDCTSEGGRFGAHAAACPAVSER